MDTVSDPTLEFYRELGDAAKWRQQCSYILYLLDHLAVDPEEKRSQIADCYYRLMRVLSWVHPRLVALQSNQGREILLITHKHSDDKLRQIRSLIKILLEHPSQLRSDDLRRICHGTTLPQIRRMFSKTVIGMAEAVYGAVQTYNRLSPQQAPLLIICTSPGKTTCVTQQLNLLFSYFETLQSHSDLSADKLLGMNI